MRTALAYLACQHVVAAACGANTDEAVAEDAAQEALLRILNHLDAFRGACRFTTWVYRIVVNVLADEMRRRTWRHQPLEEARIPTAPPAAPETLAERHATWAVIQDAIAQDLTPRQQHVLVARTVHQELLIVRPTSWEPAQTPPRRSGRFCPWRRGRHTSASPAQGFHAAARRGVARADDCSGQSPSTKRIAVVAAPGAFCSRGTLPPAAPWTAVRAVCLSGSRLVLCDDRRPTERRGMNHRL